MVGLKCTIVAWQMAIALPKDIIGDLSLEYLLRTLRLKRNK